MGIFRKHISKEPNDTVFVGANVPLHINTYLTLYSIASSISKSKLITNLIAQLKEDTEEELDLNKLIAQVSAKGYVSYEIERTKTPFSNIKFFNDMKNELLKKGIDNDTCQTIINNVKNEAKHK